MKNKVYFIYLLLPVLLWGENDFPPAGFTSLFNGQNLNGWWGAKTEDPAKWMEMDPVEFRKKHASSLDDIKLHWRVENGELINDGNGLYLTTDQNYDDFELWLEYKTVAGADSGIYLRGVPQVQIWDTTEEGGKWKFGADKGSGGLWNNRPGKGWLPIEYADKPFGEWNQFKIKMVDDLVTVYLNEKLVVDNAALHNYWDRKTPLEKRLPLVRSGPIQLQTHGGEIRWRNIFIKEILPSCCEPGNEDGFVSVFNGKDFSGWKGSIENYQIINQSIQCIKGKGGTVFTEKQYGDFSVILEFNLPEGGNNGLAIRYPGRGNAAYDAMCELQVLDSQHIRYAKLDPRQHHGSVYGMVPAKRGYLKPAGEWNTQKVEVWGSNIMVTLNGEKILRTDLSKVKHFMADKEHPGLAIRKGHFGFAGHKDPVAFRNIRIRED